MTTAPEPLVRTALLSLWIAAVPLPAAAASPPRLLPAGEVPAELAPAVAKGEAAMKELRERLFARLNQLLVQGGPITAIRVCRLDAPAIAKEIADAHGVKLGRTSHRLRNPSNAPRPWASEYLEASAGKKAGAVEPAVFDLGDRLGLLRPIGVMSACTRCHGAVEGIDHDVKRELAQHYPADQATGFSPGDLRGFLWVEVPKR